MVEGELSRIRVEVEELAVAAQSMPIRSCCRASSSEKPRRKRSRKKPSPGFPSFVVSSALQMARTSGARSRAAPSEDLLRLEDVGGHEGPD